MSPHSVLSPIRYYPLHPPITSSRARKARSQSDEVKVEEMGAGESFGLGGGT